jgi:hypothetical protein
MSQNLISAEFSAEDQLAAIQAIQQLQSLPFLIGLSNKDKQRLNKMGDKSRIFVDQALSVAKQNGHILPTQFDIDEFDRDVELYNALYPINAALSKLSELVDGTLMVLGSNAYTAALDVYTFAKMSDDVTGLEELRATMGVHFRSNGNRKPVEAE